MTTLSNEHLDWLASQGLPAEDETTTEDILWLQDLFVQIETDALLSTDIVGIYVQCSSNNGIRLIDTVRRQAGEWHSDTAILEMPDDMKSPDTGRGYWMYYDLVSNTILPARTLLEVY